LKRVTASIRIRIPSLGFLLCEETKIGRVWRWDEVGRRVKADREGERRDEMSKDKLFHLHHQGRKIS